MYSKLFFMLIGGVLLSFVCSNSYADVDKNAQNTQKTIPQSAPNVVLVPSNHDLQLTDKIFDNAGYDHLQYVHSDDQSDNQTDDSKELFKIPDAMSEDINN
ncbi:MAG: hypothetical protein PVG30_03590 [Gammaproteobacteria bacterium]|jgi:hypothetical protein